MDNLQNQLNDKVMIRVYKSDLPRINLLRHQMTPAMSQPDLINFLLSYYHDAPIEQHAPKVIAQLTPGTENRLP